MLDEISNRLEGRSFAVSSMGFTSLVPREARLDDRIALVQSNHAPFIVRPSGSEFQFIGLAYVHGIADGELWRNFGQKRDFGRDSHCLTCGQTSM